MFQGPFVAAFASSNLGDVSPNVKGPHCPETGLPVDGTECVYRGKVLKAVAKGPGEDMFESTRIIAEKMVEKSVELLEDTNNFTKVGL